MFCILINQVFFANQGLQPRGDCPLLLGRERQRDRRQLSRRLSPPRGAPVQFVRVQHGVLVLARPGHGQGG